MTEKLKGFTATPVIVERVPHWKKHYYVIKEEFIPDRTVYTPKYTMVFEDDLE